MGWSAVTLVDTFTATAMPSAARMSLTRTVWRDDGASGTRVTCIGTGLLLSSEPWKDSTAIVAEGVGFWRVRYSTNPGRTAPSAKLHSTAGDWAPTTSSPPL